MSIIIGFVIRLGSGWADQLLFTSQLPRGEENGRIGKRAQPRPFVCPIVSYSLDPDFLSFKATLRNNTTTTTISGHALSSEPLGRVYKLHFFGSPIPDV
ncbi:hypothetical protein F5X96DRAFT_656996 [Biscogniauxia mediterranea]|nr:hypothetical protein F5X96DRAFT_656996 [Biscogniauxia mediterranea]